MRLKFTDLFHHAKCRNFAFFNFQDILDTETCGDDEYNAVSLYIVHGCNHCYTFKLHIIYIAATQELLLCITVLWLILKTSLWG